MSGSFLLAYIAGLVTIFNPCVLPILPILLGSALSQSRLGPVALTAGLVFSFSTFGFAVIAFGYSIGLNEAWVRFGAGLLLAAAGVLLIWPRAHAAFSAAAAPLVNVGHRWLAHRPGHGVSGQFAIGSLLGLVWAPCVGPTLGVAIASASQGENLISSFAVFLVFGFGIATSILAIGYGSRSALAQRRARTQGIARYGKPIFGATLLLVGLMIVSGVDRTFEAAILEAMPAWLVLLTTRF